jgi:uncharacterized repeat protein (TIGR03943 family)
MNRRAQAVVMLLLGGAIVKASIADVYLRYVKQGLRPLLIVAGLLLITAAVMTLWYDLRPATHTDAPAGDGHGHAHREPRVAWLLILPVLGLLLVTPPALGSYAAAKTGSALAAHSSDADYPALPAGDPAPLPLLDYASRAVFDHGRSLTGRKLQLTGFLTPGPDGHPMLARIIVSCCAADGRPIKVGLTGNLPNGVAANTWLQIVGTYTPQTAVDPINGAVVPYLKVITWQQIAAPTQQYE